MLEGRGTRISQKDIRELNEASERLALVANMIKRSRPVWIEDGIQLLIQANEVIVRLQNRGAGVFQRYIERQQRKQLGVAATAAERAEPSPENQTAMVELSED